MDRESLRPLVETALGTTKLTVLSNESINAELDDALVGITDDAQVDDAFTKRLAERLIRMNGNVAKDAGIQINDWKKRHPVQPPKKDDEEVVVEPSISPELKALQERLAVLEERDKARTLQAANDAVVSKVRDGLGSLFKEGGITANPYFVDRAFSRFKLPVLSEGEEYDVTSLVKDVEELYYSELKSAGIDYAKPRRGNNGKGSGPDQAALSRRAAFIEKQRRSGRLPNEKE